MTVTVDSTITAISSIANVFNLYKLRGLSPRANYTDRAAAAGEVSANFCG